MTDRELMQQALEALEFYYDQHGEESDARVIAALRERLAQPELECDGKCCVRVPRREWVGLTDDELEMLELKHAPPVHPEFVKDDDWWEFARAIEAKLKEKNA